MRRAWPQLLRCCALAAALQSTAPPRSLYVHLPFCRRRCFYCDFPVVVAGEASATRDDATARYVDLLENEMASWDARAAPLDAVYLGGGTPSLVEPAHIRRLLDGVRGAVGVAEGAEVTIECDPGTFDAEKLAAYVAAGVTRVSLGVQSFDDGVLEAAGRAHRRADALAAVAAVRAADLPHGWSLDLISGLPGLDGGLWRDTLAEALAFEPPHVSSYDLQVEAGTAFRRWYDDDGANPSPARPALPDEALAADMYRDAGPQRATGGARRGSLGLGATSSAGGDRFTRPRAMADYEAWVAGGAAVGESDESDGADWLLDEPLTGLRTSDGVDLGRVRAEYGADAEAAVRRGAADAVAANLATLEGTRSRSRTPTGSSSPTSRCRPSSRR
ncbi:coproporphyrinogen oxidase [Aureococcus anophagefferens]|nr:coproporphyrinogen oxidase [Aureococcus anophagefferens]